MCKLKFYTPAEVRRIFGVSRTTVYRWIEEGLLRAVEIPNPDKGNPPFVYRIPEEALIEFVENNITVGQLKILVQNKSLLKHTLKKGDTKKVVELLTALI